MSFTSLSFYGWLVAALVVFHATPGRWRVGCLLTISCAFYLAASPLYFLLLAGQTAVAYVAGRALAGARSDGARTVILLFALIPVLSVLTLLKVEGALVGLLMPLGVSYYTFKIVSYLLEVYWDDSQVERRAVDFAAFVAFAPQMLSGPIQRPFDFFPQLGGLRAGRFDALRFEAGWFAILRGLMLKLLIGDRLGSFIATVDVAPERYSVAVLGTVALCYTLQLYADFAGYTLIAIGIGRSFGIESPQNFNAPFAASNIQEFWRRWHMSLSSWVADYVFAPLSMATRDFGRIGLIGSLFTSMTLIGLWHGLALTFLVFGLLHGLYVSCSALTMPYRNALLDRRRYLLPFHHHAGAVITFLLMTFSMIFWRAPSLGSAVLHLQLLSGVMPNGGLGFQDIRTDVAEPVFACMAIAFYHGLGAPGFRWVGRQVGILVPSWVVGGFALLLLSALTPEAGSSFIYGQF